MMSPRRGLNIPATLPNVYSSTIILAVILLFYNISVYNVLITVEENTYDKRK